MASDWSEVDGALRRRFKTTDFASALELVAAVGALAEAANHHPDITFGWGYVEVSLYTHSKQAITENDHQLAEQISQLI